MTYEADGAPLRTEADVPHLNIAYEEKQRLNDCRLLRRAHARRGDTGVTLLVLWTAN